MSNTKPMSVAAIAAKLSDQPAAFDDDQVVARIVEIDPTVKKHSRQSQYALARCVVLYRQLPATDVACAA